MRVPGHRAAQRRGAVARGFLGLLGVLVLGTLARAADLDLNAYRGKVVYLDFWASWCGPCKQSFPWMETLKDAYGRQGLTVIAVNLDMDRADADIFLERFRPTFEVRFDPKGELAALYKVRAMPSSVLIDRHGVARFTHEGYRPVDGAAYEAQVRELLAEK
jgi:cytochrome c biogenesis protein CcmG, thiol:disulfide interchange protein DsbE